MGKESPGQNIEAKVSLNTGLYVMNAYGQTGGLLPCGCKCRFTGSYSVMRDVSCPDVPVLAQVYDQS